MRFDTTLNLNPKPTLTPDLSFGCLISQTVDLRLKVHGSQGAGKQLGPRKYRGRKNCQHYSLGFRA